MGNVSRAQQNAIGTPTVIKTICCCICVCSAYERNQTSTEPSFTRGLWNPCQPVCLHREGNHNQYIFNFVIVFKSLPNMSSWLHITFLYKRSTSRLFLQSPPGHVTLWSPLLSGSFYANLSPGLTLLVSVCCFWMHPLKLKLLPSPS